MAPNVFDFALSPDGETVAATQTGAGAFDIWFQNSGGGTPSRFTFGPRPGWASPIWSPDGERVIFKTADFAGLDEYEIRIKHRDGSEPERTIGHSDVILLLWDASPDGAHLLYSRIDEAGFDIFSAPLEGDGETTRVAGSGRQSYAQYSPDGRWLAYVSNELDDFQVYVQPYDATGAVWQVSTDGGSMPRWRGDSRELYYRAPDGTLMAVTIDSREGTASLEHGTPQPLFDALMASRNGRFTYEPDSDGQRFLVTATATGSKEPIRVILNWPASINE